VEWDEHMPENGQLDSFRRNLDRFLSEEARSSILERYEHVCESSPEELSMWCKRVLARLDSLVEEPTRTRLMQVCGHECAE
jgi:hypothetical protein